MRARCFDRNADREKLSLQKADPKAIASDTVDGESTGPYPEADSRSTEIAGEGTMRGEVGPGGLVEP